MTLYEFTIVAGFALGLATVRFGVPVLVTWGIGRILGMVTKPTT